MKGKNILIVLVILSLFVLVSCQGSEPSDNDTETAVEKETTDEMIELTSEELSKYDGKDGSKAYVAVDGIIYDVTSLNAWQNGMHNGVTAGKDLTDEIKNDSPHGTSKLSKAKKVGKLVE